MRRSLYYISLILLLFSCDRYIPYPVLTDEDALLMLECTAGGADSTMVFVSKKYMITHEHRPSDTGEEPLNSSLKFVVNGETLDCKKYVTSDKYVVYHQFRAGDRIEVFCSAPGLPDVTAATVIPEAPADIIKDFNYVVEGNILKGGLVVNCDQTAGLHLSAALDITKVTHKYYEEVYVSSIVHRYSQPLSINGNGQCIFDYLLPKEYIGPDDEGKIFRETTDTEIRFKLNVLSEELYFAKLHQQSSTMSPSSYTNVKGGLGYVGAVNAITIGTFTSEAQ